LSGPGLTPKVHASVQSLRTSMPYYNRQITPRLGLCYTFFTQGEEHLALTTQLR